MMHMTESDDWAAAVVSLTKAELTALRVVLDAAEGWASELDSESGPETAIRGAVDRLRSRFAPVFADVGVE